LNSAVMVFPSIFLSAWSTHLRPSQWWTLCAPVIESWVIETTADPSESPSTKTSKNMGEPSLSLSTFEGLFDPKLSCFTTIGPPEGFDPAIETLTASVRVPSIGRSEAGSLFIVDDPSRREPCRAAIEDRVEGVGRAPEARKGSL